VAGRRIAAVGRVALRVEAFRVEARRAVVHRAAADPADPARIGQWWAAVAPAAE